MARGKSVSQRTLVRQLRVSVVATRITNPAGLGPNTFQDLLADPAPVFRGLPLTLPYAADTRPDLRFWSMLLDGVTLDAGLVIPEFARKLRKFGVPLRYAATIAVPAVPGLGLARIEAHLLPYGVAAVATVDLTWPRLVPLSSAQVDVETRLATPTTVTGAGRALDTTLDDAAGALANLLVDHLGGPEPRVRPDYRLTTVIEGSFAPTPRKMPAPNDFLHAALHQLSGGDDAPATPDTAFVPFWAPAGGTFAWLPTRLLYMLDRGLGVWFSMPDRLESMGDRHRRLTLLVAHLTASVGLISAAITSNDQVLSEWAREAALRLGRLYGPAQPLLDQGFESRRFLVNVGAVPDIVTLLGRGLVETYGCPQYP